VKLLDKGGGFFVGKVGRHSFVDKVTAAVRMQPLAVAFP
jgi:hypothetical protein